MTEMNFYYILELLASLAGFAALVFGSALMIAFSRAMTGAEGATRHFAQAVRWISTAYVYRTIYWDVIRPLVPLDVWIKWSALVGGLSVNIVWSVAFVFGAYHGLRGLHQTIPPSEREDWHWALAWAYPPWSPMRPFRGVMTTIRANARRRRRERGK